MNSKRDFDRAVDQWLDDGSDATPPEVIDAVLLAVRSTPQERDFRVPWRATSMTSYLRVAAVIAVAVIASTAAIATFGPGGFGFGGTSATPSPSPALLARGNFVTDGSSVELEATAQGSVVTGHMTVSNAESDGTYAFAVDLQCTRMTDDGLLIIGGYTTEANRLGAVVAPVGSHAAIVLKRESPMEATVWTQRGGPAYETLDCLAYLDEKLTFEISVHPDGDWMTPIEGTIEFSPQ